MIIPMYLSFSSIPSSTRSIQLPVLHINSIVLLSAVLNSLGWNQICGQRHLTLKYWSARE